MIPRSGRVQSWRYELWNMNGYMGRNLAGVQGGELEWQKNQAIKGRGTLRVSGVEPGSLLDVFIRPVLIIEGWGEQPYGLWVPALPRRAYGRATWSGEIGLLSFESLATLTSAASVLNTGNDITVRVTSGTVVTSWVASALAAYGFTRVAIAASTKTENALQAFTEGETLLQVVNAELDRISHTSLYSDMAGTLRSDVWVAPADRPEAFSDLRPFDVNGTPFMLSTFDVSDPSATVPNRVRAVGNPVGWLPGQTAVAVNNDPTSPYSVANRGYVIEKVYRNVNALSQADVQSYASRQLLNLSGDGRKFEMSFLHLPGAAINQVFYVNVPRAGAPMFATMDSLTVDTSDVGVSRAVFASVTAVDEEELT